MDPAGILVFAILGILLLAALIIPQFQKRRAS